MCAHLTGSRSCFQRRSRLWCPLIVATWEERASVGFARGFLCLVCSHPSSVIDLSRAPGYFLFLRDAYHRDDSQAKLKIGISFPNKETFLKWWAGVGRRGQEVTDVLDTQAEFGCRAWSSAEAGQMAYRWCTGGLGCTERVCEWSGYSQHLFNFKILVSWVKFAFQFPKGNHPI